MNKELIDAVRNGTPGEIAGSVMADNWIDALEELAEAIVAAREKPGDVALGVVKAGLHGRSYITFEPQCFSNGDRVTITREPTSG